MHAPQNQQRDGWVGRISFRVFANFVIRQRVLDPTPNKRTLRHHIDENRCLRRESAVPSSLSLSHPGSPSPHGRPRASAQKTSP
jgi:hypothetical protein